MNVNTEIDYELEVKRFCVSTNTTQKVRGDEISLKICPFCNGGKNGHDQWTFSINKTNGAWNCLRCDRTGNLYTLSDDPIIDYKLPERRVKEVRRHVRRIKSSVMEADRHEPGSAAIEYMKRRGISEETVRKYGISTVAKGYYKGCVAIPFYAVNGDLLFLKYRNADGSDFHGKGKERSISANGRNDEERKRDEQKHGKWQATFFGMKQCSFDGSPLVVTEGQMDALACAEAGITNVVSVPLGKQNINWFNESEDAQIFINRFTELIVFGDNEAGEVTLVDNMRKIFSRRVRVVRIEDYLGEKDANDILLKHGKEKILDAVHNAVSLKVKRVKEISEIRSVNLSEFPRILSGVNSLDKVIGGLYFGNLVILSGARGEGKSTFASQLAGFAVNQGLNVFFYSGELIDYQWKLWFKLQIAGADGISLQHNPVTGESEPLIKQSEGEQIENWYKNKVFLFDNASVDDEETGLIKTMEECICQYDCRFLVIDNLMSAISDDNLNADLNRQQTKFIKTLEIIAKKYGVIIVVVAHLRKGTKGTTDNDNVSGSGNITNACDLNLQFGIPADMKADETQDRTVKVLKNRWSGKLNFDGILLHYEPMTKRLYGHGEDPNWKFWGERGSDFIDVDEDYEEAPF